jgi:hypothetical protein
MLLQIKVITGVFGTGVAGLVALAVLAASSNASAARPGLRCTGAAEPLNFRAYSMGPVGLGALPRTSVVHICNHHRSPGAYPKGYRMEDYISVFYGTCSGESCLPPVEIQSWPACIRNRARYWTWDPQHERWVQKHRHDFTIRGVPAAVFETSPNNARVEVYTGKTTVVIFTTTLSRAKLIARRLVSESPNPTIHPTRRHVARTPTPPLPSPAPGALTDKLRCRA